MKEKFVTFTTKEKSKFLQNHQEGGEEEGDFSVKNLGLFFQS